MNGTVLWNSNSTPNLLLVNGWKRQFSIMVSTQMGITNAMLKD